MDLATIEITPEEAADRLKEIERLVRDERTIEDESLAMAYRAAKRGHQVISMSRAFTVAGEFPEGRPKLALVRAAGPDGVLTGRCRVDVSAWSNKVRYQFTDPDLRNNPRGTLVGRGHVNVSVDDTRLDNRREWKYSSGTTIVPLIPAKVRPKLSRLRHIHILWEVEKWDPTPPVDPALVRHIRGDLWAVLATWDLTELERLVLTERTHP